MAPLPYVTIEVIDTPHARHVLGLVSQVLLEEERKSLNIAAAEAAARGDGDAVTEAVMRAAACLLIGLDIDNALRRKP